MPRLPRSTSSDRRKGSRHLEQVNFSGTWVEPALSIRPLACAHILWIVVIGGIRIQADENKESDDERFTKENYSKFNFPAQNSQGLTSVYSKEPANLWKEALSEIHGKPRLFANEVKTNIDTFWQLNMKLTVLMPLICLSRYTKIIQIQTRRKWVNCLSREVTCLSFIQICRYGFQCKFGSLCAYFHPFAITASKVNKDPVLKTKQKEDNDKNENFKGIIKELESELKNMKVYFKWKF